MAVRELLSPPRTSGQYFHQARVDQHRLGGGKEVVISTEGQGDVDQPGPGGNTAQMFEAVIVGLINIALSLS
jgi:hypothetical protein